MGRYRISDLNIEVNTECQKLLDNLDRFKSDINERPNLILEMSNDIILQHMNENEGVPAETIQIDYMSCRYARELFDFNGISLSSIAVNNNGHAVLFSSPFENIDLLQYIDNDKVFEAYYPAIRLIYDEYIVYDTPFGERADLSKETRIPLSSIVFVDSSRFSTLKKLEPKDFVAPFTRAVMNNIKNERTKHILFYLEKLMKKVDFYGVSKLDDLDFILERV